MSDEPGEESEDLVKGFLWLGVVLLILFMPYVYHAGFMGGLAESKDPHVIEKMEQVYSMIAELMTQRCKGGKK